jgi:hypothetical protein
MTLIKHSFRFFYIIWTLLIASCEPKEERCETYECRRENIFIYLDNYDPVVGEPNKLTIKRQHFYLPKLRVYIGEYDENFKLPDNVEPQYFLEKDSVASMNLIFETAGSKNVRGIIEEYKFVSEDSIYAYTYRFDINVNVTNK